MEHSPSSKRIARTLIRLAGLLVIGAVAFSVSGCDKDVHRIHSINEGTRIYLGDAFYQIQMSRQLNPKDVEDSFYLDGQPAPAKGDTYFGIFLYVTNEELDRRVLPVGADQMKIVTSAGDEFKSIPVKAPGWGYAPSPIGRGGVIPIPDSPAAVGPIRGGLVLFRVSQAALDSRPLEFEIKGPGGKTGSITLDI